MDWFMCMFVTFVVWILVWSWLGPYLENNRLSYDFAKATGQNPQNKRWLPLEKDKRTDVIICVEEVSPDPANPLYSYNWKWELEFDLFNADENPQLFRGHSLSKHMAFKEAKCAMVKFMEEYVASHKALAKPEYEHYWV